MFLPFLNISVHFQTVLTSVEKSRHIVGKIYSLDISSERWRGDRRWEWDMMSWHVWKEMKL